MYQLEAEPGEDFQAVSGVRKVYGVRYRLNLVPVA